MIDMHTHVLPNIDDGASSVEEAIAMTKRLEEEGIAVAICTPHFIPARETLHDFEVKRTRSMDKMVNSKVTLIAASETQLHPYLLHYPDMAVLCIQNTRYLILELPFTKRWKREQYDLIKQMMYYHGVIPIIAHIERYPVIKKAPWEIKKLLKLGCVIQLNTSSILSEKVRKRALYYIRRGYVDVLGSDCHNLTTRPPVHLEAWDIIQSKLGKEVMEELIENAAYIVRGDRLLRHKLLEQLNPSYSDFK